MAINQYKFEPINLIPPSFCGVTSCVFPFAMIFCKKDSKVLQFVSTCALFGGLLTMIYPDFIGQNESFFYDRTISGLIHHSLALYNFFLILMLNQYTPSMKNWVSFPLGLCVYMTFGIFMITIVGRGDAMYIYTPLLEGTIFNWAFTGFLFIVVYTILLLIYEAIVLPKDKQWVVVTTRKIKTKIQNIKAKKLEKEKNVVEENVKKDEIHNS